MSVWRLNTLCCLLEMRHRNEDMAQMAEQQYIYQGRLVLGLLMMINYDNLSSDAKLPVEI